MKALTRQAPRAPLRRDFFFLLMDATCVDETGYDCSAREVLKSIWPGQLILLRHKRTPSPSRGGLGWGWVQHRADFTHPHPVLPLEGEGTCLWMPNSCAVYDAVRLNSLVGSRQG